MTDNPNILPAFPQYPTPAPAPQPAEQSFWATHKQASPLLKQMHRMLKGPKANAKPKSPSRARGKGLVSNQNVHVTHKKNVTYY